MKHYRDEKEDDLKLKVAQVFASFTFLDAHYIHLYYIYIYICIYIQGGPLQVINRVITPINGLING